MCRDAQDAKRDIQAPHSPSLVTTAYCAPAALGPCRFATPLLRSVLATELRSFATQDIRPRLAFRGLRTFVSLSMVSSE
jgi:hypothetical protein